MENIAHRANTPGRDENSASVFQEKEKAHFL